MKDLQLLYYNPTAGQFSTPDTLDQSASGVDCILQRLLKLFYTDQGSNYWNATYGSNIIALLSSPYASDSTQLSSLFGIYLEAVKLNLQAQLAESPSTDSFQDLRLTSLTHDFEAGAWIAIVEVTINNRTLSIPIA
jgi:hypothetical protein